MLQQVIKEDINKVTLDSVLFESMNLEKKSKATFRDFFDAPSNYKDDCSDMKISGPQPQAESQLVDLNSSRSKNNLSEAWEVLNRMTDNSQAASNDGFFILTNARDTGREQPAPINDSHETLFGASDRSTQGPVIKNIRDPIEFMEGTRVAPIENSFDKNLNDFASNQTGKDHTRPSEAETKDLMSFNSSPSRPDLMTSPTQVQNNPFDMKKKHPGDNPPINLQQSVNGEIPQEEANVLIPVSVIPMSMISKHGRNNQSMSDASSRSSK